MYIVLTAYKIISQYIMQLQGLFLMQLGKPQHNVSQHCWGGTKKIEQEQDLNLGPPD